MRTKHRGGHLAQDSLRWSDDLFGRYWLLLEAFSFSGLRTTGVIPGITLLLANIANVHSI